MRRAVAVLALFGCDDVFSIDHVGPPPPADAAPLDAALHGPSLVCVSETFCIDSTEVTRGQYADFLATEPTATGTGCSADDLTPAGSWPVAPGDEDRPVVNVDWCDAYSYCAWAGKRLCGRIGGGPVSMADATDVTQSEWYFACTGGHQGQLYPYGNAYSLATCNDSNQHTDVRAVTADPQCVGGFAGILDMSGNVYEWEDACGGSAADSGCYIRGGDFTEGAGLVTCDTAITHMRNQNAYSRFGFRCCLDL
jgi:formylglycine-generating enzyme required for sulfatase activity